MLHISRGAAQSPITTHGQEQQDLPQLLILVAQVPALTAIPEKTILQAVTHSCGMRLELKSAEDISAAVASTM
jgi:hypothetical protein